MNKKDELTAQESERRFREMLENVQLIAVLLDLEGRVTFCNEFLLQLTGYTRDEVLGCDWFAQFVPGAWADVKETFLLGLKRGEMAAHYENPIRTKSGEERLIRFSNTIRRDEQGEVIGTTSLGEDITDRKQAETVIMERERQLSTLIGNLPGFAYRCRNDANFTTEFVSDGVANVTGYPAGDFREHRREFGQLIHPDDQEQVAEEIQAALKENRPFELTYRILPAMREQKWVWERGMGIKNANGEVEALEGFVTDITERKRAEEELQRNEQVLRLFVENSPASIAMFDRDMKYIVASRRYLVDYDLGDQNVVGHSHYEIFPEMPERWKEIHRRCLAGAVERAEEDPFPRASGRLDWVRWEIHPWYERTGEIGGIILFSEVVTEHKRAEEKLRLSNERFVNAFNFSPAGLTITRIADGKFLDVNEAFLRMFEFKREEVIGHTSTELNILSLEERAKLIQAQIESGGLRQAELVSRAKSGRIVNLLFSSKPMELEGEPHHITTMIDITERKRAEEELRFHRDRLADLSKKLVEVHEAESRAIGRELHDQIGQMLTALKLNIEIASQLPPELREKKNKQTQELVNDLLKRVSALSLELRPPMLDDLGLIPALLWHINRFEEQSGIAVSFKHSGAEGRRFGAEVETTAYRVIQEAFTNIARHARAGRTSLEVHAGGGRMKIQIEDDGAGFDPQAAFEKHRGLGGMRERIGLLNGTIHVESQTGKGASLFIELPLKENA